MEILFSWPAAAALIVSVTTITIGAIRIFGQGRPSMAHQQQNLATRIHDLETCVVRLEADVSGTLTNQIADIKEDLRRLERKIVTFFAQVVEGITKKDSK